MTDSGSGDAPWIDVSVTVRHGMAYWPGNPPIVLERSMGIGRGDDCNLSHLALGVPAGELQEHALQAGERVLFRTSNSPRCWQTDRSAEDFVYISEEAAVHLAQTRVRAVGVDYLSVGGYSADGAKIHRILLEAGIWIIEGVQTQELWQGRFLAYRFVASPLVEQAVGGAPDRATRGGPAHDHLPVAQRLLLIPGSGMFTHG